MIETLLDHCSDELLAEWLMRSEKEGNPLIAAANPEKTDIACAILKRLSKMPSEANVAADKQATNDGANVIVEAATGTQDAVSEISSDHGGENVANGADPAISQQTNTLWDQIKDKTPRGLGVSIGEWVKQRFTYNSESGDYKYKGEPENDQTENDGMPGYNSTDEEDDMSEISEVRSSILK